MASLSPLVGALILCNVTCTGGTPLNTSYALCGTVNHCPPAAKSSDSCLKACMRRVEDNNEVGSSPTARKPWRADMRATAACATSSMKCSGTSMEAPWSSLTVLGLTMASAVRASALNIGTIVSSSPNNALLVPTRVVRAREQFISAYGVSCELSWSSAAAFVAVATTNSTVGSFTYSVW